jgi:acyl carrier protein
MNPYATAPSSPDTSLEREVAEMIVTALNLEVGAGEIRPEDPLYGEGLGLDSIDILEVALVVSKQFGIQLKAESEDNYHIFKSLRSLTAYIAEHRTK